MAGYIQTVTNDEGEILGTETLYDDDPYEDSYDEYERDLYDYDPDPFRSEQDSDLAGEWSALDE